MDFHVLAEQVGNVKNVLINPNTPLDSNPMLSCLVQQIWRKMHCPGTTARGGFSNCSKPQDVQSPKLQVSWLYEHIACTITQKSLIHYNDPYSECGQMQVLCHGGSQCPTSNQRRWQVCSSNHSDHARRSRKSHSPFHQCRHHSRLEVTCLDGNTGHSYTIVDQEDTSLRDNTHTL